MQLQVSKMSRTPLKKWVFFLQFWWCWHRGVNHSWNVVHFSWNLTEILKSDVKSQEILKSFVQESWNLTWNPEKSWNLTEILKYQWNLEIWLEIPINLEILQQSWNLWQRLSMKRKIVSKRKCGILLLLCPKLNITTYITTNYLFK